MLVRLFHIKLETGNPAGALDEMNELLPMGQVCDERETLVVTRRKLDDARVAVKEDRAPVRVS
jgi:hypothetical protein